MKHIVIGKQYRLTMPNNGLYINISRQQALSNTEGSDIVTIEMLRYSEVYGGLARINENGYWVSYEHLAPVSRIIKYNKEKLCQN